MTPVGQHSTFNNLNCWIRVHTCVRVVRMPARDLGRTCGGRHLIYFHEPKRLCQLDRSYLASQNLYSYLQGHKNKTEALRCTLVCDKMSNSALPRAQQRRLICVMMLPNTQQEHHVWFLFVQIKHGLKSATLHFCIGLFFRKCPYDIAGVSIPAVKKTWKRIVLWTQSSALCAHKRAPQHLLSREPSNEHF